MAIGPIGNTIYVNQQMATVASEKNAILNRFELQMAAAANATQEKQAQIEEVRPTEENQGVDADREHTKEQADQEGKRSPKEEKQDEEENPPKRLHILDVKV